MSYIQYVGDAENYKVFCNVSNRFFPDGKGSFSIMEKNDILIVPIKISAYDEMIHHSAMVYRYEVRQYGEAFIADEGHRDAYAFHLPGFFKIKELSIGDIIPISGFKTPEFLSDDDRKLINKEITMKDLKLKRSFL